MRLGAALAGPGVGFLGADREEGDQIEQLVAGMDGSLQSGLLEPEGLQEVPLFPPGRRAARPRPRWPPRPSRSRPPPRRRASARARRGCCRSPPRPRRRWRRRAPAWRSAAGAGETAASAPRSPRRFAPACPRAGPRPRRIEPRGAAWLPFAAARALDRAVDLALDALQVGQHELGLDGLGVADRVDPLGHMGHLALEAAQHVERSRRPPGCWPRNWLPRPSPLARAGLTRPAMSTNSIWTVGIGLGQTWAMLVPGAVEPLMRARATRPTFGSMVQNGIVRGFGRLRSRSRH